MCWEVEVAHEAGVGSRLGWEGEAGRGPSWLRLSREHAEQTRFSPVTQTLYACGGSWMLSRSCGSHGRCCRGSGLRRLVSSRRCTCGSPAGPTPAGPTKCLSPLSAELDPLVQVGGVYAFAPENLGARDTGPPLPSGAVAGSSSPPPAWSPGPISAAPAASMAG